jgi:hypothetical protein
MSVVGRTGMFPHKIDASTDANATVDYEHKEVHAGKAFYNTRVTSFIDVGDIQSIRLKTPDTTTWIHMLWVIEAQANVLIELREGITDNIAPESNWVKNRNRNYSDDDTELVLDVTLNAAATAGTVIWSWSAGGAAANPSVAKTPGVVRASGEFVLKQNENYELRITSTVDDNVTSSYITWYEHANVE